MDLSEIADQLVRARQDVQAARELLREAEARQERLQRTYDGGDGWLTVGAVLETAETSSWRVDENRPLTELLSSEPLGRFGALMAVDGEGVLRGVVTIEQVRRALQTALGSPAA